MQLSSPITEKRLLLCALEHPSPKVRNYILAETRAEDFRSPYGKEVRQRIDALLRLDKPLGTSLDMGEDPGLTDEARDWIKGTRKARRAASSCGRRRIERFIETVKSHRRVAIAYEGLERATSILKRKSVGETDIDELCHALESTLMNVKQGFDQQPLLHLGYGQTVEDVKSLHRRLTAKQTHRFIPSGIDILDYYITGFERGNLVTLSANSGGGKTAVALNMAIAMFLKGYSVCFVSMEMPETELLHRIISNQTDIPHDVVRLQNSFTQSDKSRVKRTLQNLYKHGKKSKARLTLWDQKDPTFTPQQMEVSLAPYRYDAIIVDYITLFYGRNMETWKMHLEYSKYLKGMSKRLDCVTTALAQLSQDEELRYGRAIRDNTDYWLSWLFDDEEDNKGEVEFRMRKARHTKRRNFIVHFKLNTMKIWTPTPDESAASEDGVSFRKPKRRRKKKGRGRRRKRSDQN